jgi:hypothetical protein
LISRENSHAISPQLPSHAITAEGMRPVFQGMRRQMLDSSHGRLLRLLIISFILFIS